MNRGLSVVKNNGLCMNCLKSGHYLRDCKSSHFCRNCQKPHHTLLHVDVRGPNSPLAQGPDSPLSVTSNASVGIMTDMLMTCQVSVEAPDGSMLKARALLDPASSSSFISERLVQSLGIPRSHNNVVVSGVAGLASPFPFKSVATLTITPSHSSNRRVTFTAIVVPCVTSDLPLSTVSLRPDWTHLQGLPLADPQFGTPGRIDLLLGVDVYVESLLHGRRSGPPNSPVAFKTIFGWVLAGKTQHTTSHHVTSHHVTTMLSDNDVLRKFWEVEELTSDNVPLSLEDQSVMNHFKDTHHQNPDGRFIVPLPRRTGVKPLRESRSQALRRYMQLEHSLLKKGQFAQLDYVMREYLYLGHAESVPAEDLQKPHEMVFYLPIHAVYKASSSTTKVRAVFDASAKTTSGISLNDCLLTGPTVHSSLIDVLLRFRSYRIAVTTDVSKMYRAIELVEQDRDLHRFLWRSSPTETVKDYRMTRLTFGVSSSSFIANMCIKQNALNHVHEFPLAAKSVKESFYVDDGLTGADDLQTAVELQKQLERLFLCAGFQLHKWNTSDPAVLEHVKPEFRELQESQPISDIKESTKTLGLEWRTQVDGFHLVISQSSAQESLTKRMLVSDIARVFDALGWFSPAVVKVKILLQRLWEEGLDWDDPAPQGILEVWERWRQELPCLLDKIIPRYYYPKNVFIASQELHGFSDASEHAYAAVVYLRMTDNKGRVHVSLVMSKTKVAPIKRLTIPRLELCGALLLSKLLTYIKDDLSLSVDSIVAWTDSMIVLSWLVGNPRRFKAYVGNRVAQIIDQIPSDQWRHVSGVDKPADCASRGLYPSDLIHHQLWWNGPSWLSLQSSEWPSNAKTSLSDSTELLDETASHVTIVAASLNNLLSFDCYSSFERLQRVLGWIIRFLRNCRLQVAQRLTLPYLTVTELQNVENYLYTTVQVDHFSMEINRIKSNRPLPKGNCLLPLSPFLDSHNILRVGGRRGYSEVPYSRIHPVILHAKHLITRLLIISEHKRLLHGGPTLMMSSLSRRFHIFRIRQTVRYITRHCTICCRWSNRPKPPIMGQLPIERLTPGPVFNSVGLDYAGPLHIKYSYTRKPVIVKAYVCVFVSLTVKAIHLELVTDLTTDAFLACLHRFVARRGLPSLLWSDHGTNFIGANHQLKEMFSFLEQTKVQKDISEFCTARRIQWKFIPQHSPHFGGIWEAAVKSFKLHFRRIVGDVKLTFEEAYTILTQIEGCLNSRPLGYTGSSDEDGIEVLTPGHFLIGQPLMSLPDPAMSFQSVSLLKRWHLCQCLTCHFWKRWSLEYLATLQRVHKWQLPTRNMAVGDVVVLIEDGIISCKWPLARVVKVYPGKDGTVRVVDIKTSKGTYRRPVHKLASLPLLEGTIATNTEHFCQCFFIN